VAAIATPLEFVRLRSEREVILADLDCGNVRFWPACRPMRTGLDAGDDLELPTTARTALDLGTEQPF
jgi:hypothetical protein